MTNLAAPEAADLDKAAAYAADMLTALGIPVDPETPMRLARSLDELAQYRGTDPTRHLSKEFEAVSAEPGLIVVSDVPFVSLCEHHLLPFTGVATLAYLPKPGRPITGLSKMARMVTEYAGRPQIQERLTDQITAALYGSLPARGAACAVRGTHMCMALRGARTGPTAAMVTTAYAGELATNPWREEFGARLNTQAWCS